ncbi:hypothetical protein BCR43DRAFT_76966 [Syncephalastrum racemosum]|uniref:Uncharacterized protein n=1 Tax=Syncephalastrum racemosum TaxID=13706 RepID=A0A1X2H2F6_SYNRA|nr:hypothetical protein BCR43DRAFT_76966 [Syncephalastrum racemosum]
MGYKAVSDGIPGSNVVCFGGPLFQVREIVRLMREIRMWAKRSDRWDLLIKPKLTNAERHCFGSHDIKIPTESLACGANLSRAFYFISCQRSETKFCTPTEIIALGVKSESKGLYMREGSGLWSEPKVPTLDNASQMWKDQGIKWTIRVLKKERRSGKIHKAFHNCADKKGGPTNRLT